MSLEKQTKDVISCGSPIGTVHYYMIDWLLLNAQWEYFSYTGFCSGQEHVHQYL